MEKTNVVEGSRSPMQMKMGDELEGNTNTLRTAETFLRLLPVGLCVSALVLMLKNSQQNQYGSVDYTDLGAFKYVYVTEYRKYMAFFFNFLECFLTCKRSRRHE